ncbi:MAG: glycosyltransferase family 4 protein [bacterium]|nr:glycosyltransferase family 4 protein [bacterium]
MKILSIYRHYWPDTTPYARLLRALAERLVEAEHSFTVYTAQPSYNDIRQAGQPRHEDLNGVRILRLRLLPERKRLFVLRVINFLLFLSRGIVHAVLVRRYDLIIVNVHPAFLMGLTVRLIRRLTGTPFIYNCMDLHPESSALAGHRLVRAAYRLLMRSDTKTCRAARLIVVPSRDMKQTLVERGVEEEKILVVHTFRLDTYGEPAGALPPPLDRDETDRFTVLFAGNIGNFQGLEQVIEATRLLQEEERIRFVFMGEGLAKQRLIEQAGALVDRTVFFCPYQPVEIAFEAMRRASLGIVCLLPGVYRTAFPSKTMMYLAAGCPVLAIVEEESRLAALVRERRLGVQVSQGDIQGVAGAIRDCFEQRAGLTSARREEIRRIGEELFGMDQALDRWVTILRDLEGTTTSTSPEPGVG